MMTIQSRIQLKLIIMLIAVFSLALIASTAVLILAINKIGLMSIQQQLDQEQKSITQHFQQIESELLELGRLVAQNPRIIESIETDNYDIFDTLFVTTSSVNNLWIFDANGHVLELFSDDPSSSDNLFSNINPPEQDAPVIDMVVIDNSYMMLAVSPIYDSDMRLIGYIVAGTTLNQDQLGAINLYRNTLGLVFFPDLPGATGISANERGNIPHLSDNDVASLRLNETALAQIQQGESLQRNNVLLRDTVHLASYYPFQIGNVYRGYLVIAIDENALLTIQSTILTISIISTIVALGAIATFVFVSIWHLILYPLELLNDAAVKFGNGNTNIRLTPKNSDEIGKVFNTFNTMAESINLRTQQLYELNSQLETRVQERTFQIKQQTAWLEMIVCQAKEIIIVSDAEGNIEIINEMGLLAMNIQEQAAIGTSLTGLLQRFANHHIQLPSAHTAIHEEITIDDHFYQYSIATIHTTASEYINGYVCVLNDITNLRRLNALQSQVIRIAAHDLRSPLTALALQLHVMERTFDSPSEKQHNALARIRASISDMHGMIDNLLNVERIEQQASGISEAIAIETLITSAVTMLDTQFTQKQQKVSVNIEENLPLLCGDPVRLLEVFRNLLSNAYKYTPQKGEISIVAFVKENGICVDVSDTGMGIDQEDVLHIFEGNFRAQSAIDVDAQGLGVGLSLSKDIIQEHGGEISVKSQKNLGTTFSVYLPIT